MVYGIDRTGKPVGISAAKIDPIINTLANIGRKGLNPPLKLDHAVEDYSGVRLLFVFIQESAIKPVHLKGKDLSNAFIRCGSTTRPASLRNWNDVTPQRHATLGRAEGIPSPH